MSLFVFLMLCYTWLGQHIQHHTDVMHSCYFQAKTMWLMAVWAVPLWSCMAYSNTYTLTLPVDSTPLFSFVNLHCESKNHVTIYSCITLAYVDRFWHSFTVGFSKEFAIKTLSCFPPHLIYVATLPWEKNVQIIPFSESKLLQKPIASSTKQLMSGANVFVHVFERKEDIEHLIWLMSTDTLTSVWLMLWK